MDVAVIDWKDSKFEKDILYEDINAPQWIDFSNHDPPVDDEAWFCRPDCDHPKTVEDFFRQRSPKSAKLHRSPSVSQIPESGDRNRRDAALKKRNFPSNKDSKPTKTIHDNENQNPNFSTPNHKPKSIKEMIKSSSEKNQFENDFLPNEEQQQQQQPPRLLKSTLSARNLFAGRDILSQVTEFCNELKRLATRAKDNGEKETVKKNVVTSKKQEVGVLQERKPLIKKKMNNDSENTPIALNMKTVRGKDDERLLQIRTNPPSPQCFSVNSGTHNSKGSRLRPQERGVLEEISLKEVKKEVKGNTNQTVVAPISTQNEGKGLDVFWFFKPCTLSS